MNLVEKHSFNKNHPRWKSLDKICFLSKNLYNYALYCIKQEYEATGRIIWYNELDKLLIYSNQFDYRILPANSAQKVLQILNINIKSFFKALESYKKNPEKFKAKPEFPKYKNKIKGRNVVVFTMNQFTLKKDGLIRFPKKSGLQPIKPLYTENIQQVRIIPNSSHYTIEIVYRKQEQPLITNDNKASIDLGINNLAALTFSNTKVISSLPI